MTLPIQGRYKQTAQQSSTNLLNNSRYKCLSQRVLIRFVRTLTLTSIMNDSSAARSGAVQAATPTNKTVEHRDKVQSSSKYRDFII
jgi:hypothetical protein